MMRFLYWLNPTPCPTCGAGEAVTHLRCWRAWLTGWLLDMRAWFTGRYPVCPLCGGHCRRRMNMDMIDCTYFGEVAHVELQRRTQR